jgi:hypothetical protein
MKYLQSFSVFESQTSATLTPDQESFLNQYARNAWSVNPATGLVDVKSSFDCSNRELKSLCGIRFGTVTGYFACDCNKLTTLEGAPQTVTGDFYCFNNKLTTLEGAPRTVPGNFYCSNNQLTTLEGAPRTVGREFSCYDNPLTSLEGAPQTVEMEFRCDNFKLNPGKWNPTGWVQVLHTGSPEAQKLILTLLYLVDWWNSQISSNPVGTLLRLSALWDRLPEDIKAGIKIPSNLQDDFDNFLDLERAGIF